MGEDRKERKKKPLAVSRNEEKIPDLDSRSMKRNCRDVCKYLFWTAYTIMTPGGKATRMSF